MKLMKYIPKNVNQTMILFDDYSDSSEGGEMWSQVCENCRKSHKIHDNKVDYNCAGGICGVFGCENEADHYVDFTEDEIEFIYV